MIKIHCEEVDLITIMILITEINNIIIEGKQDKFKFKIIFYLFNIDILMIEIFKMIIIEVLEEITVLNNMDNMIEIMIVEIEEVFKIILINLI